MKNSELNSLTDLIQQHWRGVEAIYLYGSEAKGQASEKSDVDLAVLASQSLSPENRFALAEKIASQLKRDVDLVDLREVPTVLQFQIVSSGNRLVCAKQEACERFEDFVYVSYARLGEERSGILKDIQSRGTIF